MSNVHRLRLTERIFFVTANLGRATAPFTEPEYPLMIKSLDDARRRLGFMLCGYVLMPDHWHALIGTAERPAISQVLHDVKRNSARRLHKLRGTAGPFWQHQFWDRFVRHAKEFAERMEYMHLNPVQKGLVARPEEWRWSSCANFSLERVAVKQCQIGRA